MKKLNLTKTNIFLISLSITLSILLSFSIYLNLSIEKPIRIEDFTSMTQDQLLSWSQENDIKIETIEEYSDEVELGKVISQDTIVGERLFAGSSIKVIISKGPDPEVMVNLIDFKGKDIGEIQQFIEMNKLLAATIEFEKSTEINSAYFIRSDIQSNSIKRGQSIKFYISTGSKEELTTIIVPDFTEYTRQQISSWGQSNNIKTNFLEEFNNDVSVGKVISQSQAPNSNIYDGSSITIKMSLGAGVVLENLVGKSKTTIDKFINDNGLKVNYTYTFSSTVNKDLGITMNPSASTKVGNGTTVNVTLSLGKISVSDFKGKALSELQAWVNEVNKQGANLKVTSTQAYSDTVTSGQIITQTPSSGDINPGTEIKASISKGKGIVVNNFVGSTTITQDGLKITTSKSYHASIPNGQIISQTPSAGSTVDRNSTVNLVISLGKVNIGSYSSLSALQEWKNSVNANGANITVTTTEAWNAATKGALVSYSPSNTSVNPGTTITAVISKGPSVVVQNYVQLNTKDQDGLSETYEYINNAAPDGTVLSQSITAGQEVARDSSIKITVSKGPLVIKKIQVPQVSYITGLSNNANTSASYVRTAFTQNAPGLTPNIIFGGFDKSCGNIHKVEPGEGEMIDEGSVVNVYIENVNCSN